MLTTEERLTKLEAQARGECPDCGRKVKGWKPMFGSFAPEWWATMRENEIDPATGHRIGCPASFGYNHPRN
jgi:hypothetical protein